MNLLVVEPASLPAVTPGPDIPALREQLAILVCTGKRKVAIGVNLKHDQMGRLGDNPPLKVMEVSARWMSG